jgi:hypothetical protein
MGQGKRVRFLKMIAVSQPAGKWWHLFSKETHASRNNRFMRRSLNCIAKIQAGKGPERCSYSELAANETFMDILIFTNQSQDVAMCKRVAFFQSWSHLLVPITS